MSLTPINPQPFIALGSTEVWLRLLQHSFPFRCGRIDFHHLPHSIEQQRRTSWSSGEFISFLTDILNHFVLPKEFIYSTDTRPEFAFWGHFDYQRKKIEELSSVPQNHYFCCPDMKWCIFFGVGGQMGFAENPKTIAPFPYRALYPTRTMPWYDIFSNHHDFRRLFANKAEPSDCFRIKQIKVNGVGVITLTVHYGGIPSFSPSRRDKTEYKSVEFQIIAAKPHITLNLFPDTNLNHLKVSAIGNTTFVSTTANPEALRLATSEVRIEYLKKSMNLPPQERRCVMNPPIYQLINLLRQHVFRKRLWLTPPAPPSWHLALDNAEILKKYFDDPPPLCNWYHGTIIYIPQRKRADVMFYIYTPDSTKLIILTIRFDDIQHLCLERFPYEDHTKTATLHRAGMFIILKINATNQDFSIVARTAYIKEIELSNYIFSLAPDPCYPDLI